MNRVKEIFGKKLKIMRRDKKMILKNIWSNLKKCKEMHKKQCKKNSYYKKHKNHYKIKN